MPKILYDDLGQRTYVRGSRTDEDRVYAREWARKRRADPEIRKLESQHTRAYQKRHPVKFGFNNDSRSAAKRGYPFTLTKEEYGRLIFSNCVYCGVAPNPINGIDRVDNTKGYTTENSATACATCNKAKHTSTIEEFTKWIARLIEFQTK
jgi:hypothetical protein